MHVSYHPGKLMAPHWHRYTLGFLFYFIDNIWRNILWFLIWCHSNTGRYKLSSLFNHLFQLSEFFLLLWILFSLYLPCIAICACASLSLYIFSHLLRMHVFIMSLISFIPRFVHYAFFNSDWWTLRLEYLIGVSLTYQSNQGEKMNPYLSFPFLNACPHHPDINFSMLLG